MAKKLMQLGRGTNQVPDEKGQLVTKEIVWAQYSEDTPIGSATTNVILSDEKAQEIEKILAL